MADKKKSIIPTIILSIISIIWIYPIVMILFNSLKVESAITTSGVFQFPTSETWNGIQNFIASVTQMDFLKSFWYSLVISVMSVVLILLCCSMCAWYIVRVNGLLSKVLYYLCVFSMVVPFQMVMFTLAKTADTLKLNNPYTICIVYLGFGAGLAVFMFTGFALRLSKLRFDKRMAGYLIQIGLPAGLQNGIFQVANLFIQAGVNTFDATMVAGNSAAANADALLYDSMAAFYTACGSFMGQNYGAGKRKRVRNSYLVSLAYSFGIGTIGGIALVIFGRQFLGLFTNDPAVVDAGMKRLTIMGFSYGFSAFMDSAIAASRALGKSVIPTVIVIIGSCIFRMVWVNTVFAYFKTIPSLYLLYIFSWGITAVVEIIYWVHVYRNTKIG